MNKRLEKKTENTTAINYLFCLVLAAFLFFIQPYTGGNALSYAINIALLVIAALALYCVLHPKQNKALYRYTLATNAYLLSCIVITIIGRHYSGSPFEIIALVGLYPLGIIVFGLVGTILFLHSRLK